MVARKRGLVSSGLIDFVVQRVSAVVLATYTLCVVGWFVVNPNITHEDLAGYFSSPVMMVFSTLAVSALAAHAWVGMWTIGTDYIRPHYFGSGAQVCRIAYQTAIVGLIAVYVVWGLSVVWTVS